MPHRGSLMFLAATLLALLPYLWQVAWPFLHSFILAAVLAIVTHPVKEWLSTRGRRPGLASLVTTLATVFVTGTIVLVTGAKITDELTSGYNALSRQSLEEGGWPALVTHTTDRAIDAVATHLPVNKDAIRTAIIEQIRDASGYLLGNIGTAVGGVTTLLITGLLVTVPVFPLAIRKGMDSTDVRPYSARRSSYCEPRSDRARVYFGKCDRCVPWPWGRACC